ncbi:predicted protein [Naegleria gruberi]|uniref:Predicted protein n=1 Tax=Naegleria gruberi TaxID=5762 RepID=D2VGT1_NAEGR|nr:uncharacterized protein NAEGRDRAFT_49413 [Naegleria gruberi]EFC44115.1 predicted protein [Naegleria gruberi]|eukprot:XP_002676859.1 predicted protein [Naegleria gruberi strain NEG-M]
MSSSNNCHYNQDAQRSCFLSFGNNEFGQLATGDSMIRKLDQMARVSLPSGFSLECIRTGYFHTIVVGRDSKSDSQYCILSSGSNNSGQLAQSINTMQSFDLKVIRDFKCLGSIKAIECGSNFTMALSKDNKLSAWGDNCNGQSGLKNWIEVTIPNPVPLKLLKQDDGNDEVIAKVVCGFDHTALICESGNVYCTGKNNFDELGVERAQHHNNNINIFRRMKGMEKFIQPSEKITQWAFGEDHSLIVVSDEKGDRLFAIGSNRNGMAGAGKDVVILNEFKQIDIPSTSRIAKVVCGEKHSAVLTVDGELFMTGKNSELQLGLPTINTYYKFTQVYIHDTFIGDVFLGDNYTIAISKKNRNVMFGTGRGFRNSGNVISSLNKLSTFERIDFSKHQDLHINSVACGGMHTIFYRDDKLFDGSTADNFKSSLKSSNCKPLSDISFIF